MKTEDIQALYKRIDYRFENMSEEELREYEINQEVKMAKLGRKRYEAAKKSGYENMVRRVKDE